MVMFQEIPLISNMQKLVLYETKARFYVVGSNNEKNKFRVLKIHRNESRELVIEDDMVEYTADEVHKILAMIESGNRPKSTSSKGNSGLFRSVSAFGIAGFVRFLEGYYMILITKRDRVALIGPHTIYKVEDTCMLYIPNIGTHYMHPDESRYVKMFQNVDLSSNFYFSYSYDLTHSLQYNMTPLQIFKNSYEESKKDEQKEKAANSKKTDVIYGIKNKPCNKFLWNAFLQKPCEDMMHPDWVIHIIHGFIGQVNICVFGKPIFVSLIGRRSSQFAGTRFLKRGANCLGSVANEVETEQIVHDASVTFLKKASVSSFIQLRGSIPLFWSQDISKMVPKPQIVIDQADPYAYVAGQHFNDVIKRFGSPMIVLNLVKMREKRRHESILTEEFHSAINYLNQFLPPVHNIQYIGFDMAGVSKKKDSNVMERLGKIANYCIKRTGFFFHSQGPQDELWKSDQLKDIQGIKTNYGKCQTGVVRTNCVDCLDRTNTAQFAVGKCALAYQLCAMGIISKPNLEYDTDCVRMLEELYEDQGNTLALQYGGSQLVHRIKGYRKIATWTYNSRDLVQTISRYYSNAFSDAEKQQSINLFLGIFTPSDTCPNLWELPTDYYLHNLDAAGKYPLLRKSYCQWWDTNVPFYLPISLEEAIKGKDGEVKISKKKATDECVDEFYEYYRPYELTFLDDLFSFSLTHSIRNVMPKHATDYSPFSQRLNLDRPLEDPGNGLDTATTSKQESANSNMMNLEESASSSENDEIEGDVDLSDSSISDNSTLCNKLISFKDIFPTTQSIYDFTINQPSKRGMRMYERHANFGESHSQSSPLADKNRVKADNDLYVISTFKLDSMYKVELPPISKYSNDIYSTYVWRGKHGAGSPTAKDLETYKKYNSNKYL